MTTNKTLHRTMAAGRKSGVLAVLILGGLTPRPAHAVSGLAAVWANDGGDKVTRDELRVSRRGLNVKNTVWDGRTIGLFGAKNEVVGFNVVLEAPSGAADVSVSLRKLTTLGGDSITSADAARSDVFNFVNRNIELFYVRYLQIKGLSRVSYETYDERHVPQRMERPWSGNGSGLGAWESRPDHDKYYPDIAVPLELIPTFNIAAGQNQSIWVDIYIPKGIPMGIYQGNLIIREGSVISKTLPVQLKVYDFSLPDMPSAKTMLYFSSPNINHRYLGSAYINPTSALAPKARLLRDRHFLVAHRHRISLIGDNVDDCNPTADHPCAEWQSRLDGSLFTAANGYDGPGVHVGNNVYSIGTYGSWNWKSAGQTAMNQHCDAWVSWFIANSPSTDYFLYLADESPDTNQMQTWAQWILSNPGPGGRLKSMATSPLTTAAAAMPALDIPTSTLGIGIPTQWQPLADRYSNDSRKRFYMYNAHRPATGSTATEDEGTALRELAWAQYKKHINRWFFWESTYYNNYQGGMGETNVLQTAKTFGTKTSVDPILGETGWNYSNGDGVLFYPGTDKVFPSDSYGLEGPMASLRLKDWRRGLQDVDYLTLAAAIDPVKVQALVNTMVPKALWEYGVSDITDPTWVRTNVSWSNDPNLWETARAQLAAIIAPPHAGR